ncbi:MAG TPA: diguanylate cyclase [Rhodocyclaceae bacterium]|nr:diguanylate cyclase [Rhodocyclaceae bacterium]
MSAICSRICALRWRQVGAAVVPSLWAGGATAAEAWPGGSLPALAVVPALAAAALWACVLWRRIRALEATRLDPPVPVEPASRTGLPVASPAAGPWEHYFALAADSGHVLEGLIDTRGRLYWVSPAFERFAGHAVEDVLAAPDFVELIIYERDRRYVREQTTQVLSTGRPADFETRVLTREGALRWVTCHWHAVRDEAGVVQGIRATGDDIQARKEAEFKLLETVAALRRAQALSEHYLRRSNEERSRLSALLDVVEAGILFMDPDHRVVYCNRALCEIWKVAEGESIVGVRDVVLQQHAVTLLTDPPGYLRHVAGVLGSREASAPFELHFSDGRTVNEFSRVVFGDDGARAIGRIWVYEDVTERRRVALQLLNLAERDPLTNLYNRRRFHEELERMLGDARRRGDDVGLLVLDLDGFKPVNDAFGHQAGDQVLTGLAQAVAAVVRRNEMFFRLGGDEFAILVPSADVQGLAGLARRVGACIAALRFDFGGSAVGVTASIGIAWSGLSGTDAEALVGAADRAMYRAKAQGGNRSEVAAAAEGNDPEVGAEPGLG